MTMVLPRKPCPGAVMKGFVGFCACPATAVLSQLWINTLDPALRLSFKKSLPVVVWIGIFFPWAEDAGQVASFLYTAFNKIQFASHHKKISFEMCLSEIGLK